MHYDWPGNVRELENALERALVLGSTDSILPDDLPEAVLEAGSTATASTDKYHGNIKETKKQLILQALQQANGNYIEAAKALGMHPNSLLRLVRNLDLKGVKAECRSRAGWKASFSSRSLNGALSNRAGSMTTAQTSASAPWTAIPTRPKRQQQHPHKRVEHQRQ